MYRVGFPGWKLAAKLGVPLLFRINVRRDEDVGIFLATSPDLHGLVVEADTMNELFTEVYSCFGMLIEEQLKQAPKSKPLAAWSGDFSPA